MRPIITLTKPAIRKCQQILSNNKKKYLHLSLKSGGCSGFEYKFKPTDTLHKLDEKVVVDDLTVSVCHKSILHLLGTEINWEQDIMGEYFSFNNPNAEMVCGCGTSFSPLIR